MRRSSTSSCFHFAAPLQYLYSSANEHNFWFRSIHYHQLFNHLVGDAINCTGCQGSLKSPTRYSLQTITALITVIYMASWFGSTSAGQTKSLGNNLKQFRPGVWKGRRPDEIRAVFGSHPVSWWCVAVFSRGRVSDFGTAQHVMAPDSRTAIYFWEKRYILHSSIWASALKAAPHTFEDMLHFSAMLEVRNTNITPFNFTRLVMLNINIYMTLATTLEFG